MMERVRTLRAVYEGHDDPSAEYDYHDNGGRRVGSTKMGDLSTATLWYSWRQPCAGTQRQVLYGRNISVRSYDSWDGYQSKDGQEYGSIGQGQLCSWYTSTASY